MKPRLWVFFFGISLAIQIAATGTPLAAQAQSVPSFEKDVKPIFDKHCIACHNAQLHQSDLNMETVESLFKGGALQGPAAIAGKSRESPLMLRLRGEKKPAMPMSGEPLPQEQIQVIARWIDQLKGTAVPAAANSETKQLAWPWVPLKAPLIPDVKATGWVKNPIDAFILAKLEEKGMQPAPSVSKRALLRRVYFDLIGLPPTPEEIDRFLRDSSPDAYEKEIEKLLADPRYGERWGRHWLDVVRYGDSVGGGLDYPLAHMWRYRDYVIRAFNEDRSYDRFVREQIAGDNFAVYGTEGKLGTAFLNLQVDIEGSGDQRRDFLTDVVNTTGSVFLGVTLGCARCHNHKYDPITQKDFYRIEAFFQPMLKPEKTPLLFSQYEMPRLRPELWKRNAEAWDEVLKKRKESENKLNEEIKKRIEPHSVLMSPQDLKDWVVPDLKRSPVSSDILLSKAEKEQRRLIGRQTARFANPNDPDRFKPMAYVPTEPHGSLGYAPSGFLLKGGNPKLKGEVIEPGFIVSLSGDPAPVNLEGWTGSRRKLLADWIASPENPLTARVMVNRIWLHHFVKGLVITPSDFGKNGGGTVHQELIDWLASRFIESGWSIKAMHRLMLQSNLYRQSLQNPKAKEYEQIDSVNRYYWRMPPIRLEAESIRDSLLAVSGQLNPTMGGPSFFPDLDDELLKRASTWWEPSTQEERNRRSIYMLQQRVLVTPLISVFDGPNISESCATREVTTVTPQVFALFNSKFAHEQSHALAQRILREVGQDPEKQIDRAFELSLQRKPSASEKAKSLAFLGQPSPSSLTNLTRAEGSEPQARSPLVDTTTAYKGSLSDFCMAMFNINEFIFLE